MTATAIAMMVVSMLVIWGGLALAIIRIRRADVEDFHRDL